jgi:3-oxoacyl-[acyl-carrier protein] reductase
LELQHKVIAITGGGRGIGAATALRLAARGCRLALVDLDDATLAQVASKCEQAGAPKVATYKVNVSSEPDVEQLFADIGNDFGALHGLINNAGITRDALTLKVKDGEITARMTLAEWQLVVDVNLTGVFLCGREGAAKMIELGCEGVIVNISSISRHGNMGQVNYSATKAGVQVMAMKPEAREKLTAHIPLRRMGQPDDIAATVQFILENDYVSGRCFDIDGGLRL